MSLAGIWDGERHLLEPGEYFLDTGARYVIDSWEEDEEEDVLSPFESPTMIPLLRETGSPRSDLDRQRFPMHDTEQAWGSLSIGLTALAMILDETKKQYQEINHQNNSHAWSFQSDEFVIERL